MIDLRNEIYTEIAKVLSEKKALSVNEIFKCIKTKGLNYSYKYVYKSVSFLSKNSILAKDKTKYSLNIIYLKSLRDFLIKASNTYELDQNMFIESVVGSLLKIFPKDEINNISSKITKYINKKIMRKLDEWYSKYYDPDSLEIKTILDISDFKGKKILEVGCGTGRVTSPISNIAKEVVAIDHNKIVIDYVSNKLKDKNIKFECFDISDLKNFKHDNFDIIITSWVGLQYSENLNKIIKNLYDLLKENGKLIVIEAYPDSEYVDILNLLKPKRTKSKEKIDLLRSSLFNKFKNLTEKIASPKYLFPNYEKLEENFKIELVYEEGYSWKDEDSEKLKDYVQNKKDFSVGEVFLLISCDKSTK